MSLKTDLEAEVKKIFKDTWDERNGTKVPDTDDIALGNEAVKLDATVLYADISDSTKMVDKYPRCFSSEVYKSFLRCAAKIIRDKGGAISAYDGDRIMAVFIGDSKNEDAVRAALKINWAVANIIRPAQKLQYPSNTYKLKQVVGIDTSDVYVSRAGIRGSNDLVWISRAANYAAKLAALDDEKPTWITNTVYDALPETLKTAKGEKVWQAMTWNVMGGMQIYRSSYAIAME